MIVQNFIPKKVSFKRKRITLNLSFHFFESLSYSVYFDLLFFFFILNSYHARLLKKTSRDKGYGWWKATKRAAEREIKIARVLQRRSHKFEYEQKDFPSSFFLFFFFYPPPFFLLVVDHSKRDHNRNVPQKNDGWNKEIHREKFSWKKTFQKTKIDEEK